MSGAFAVIVEGLASLQDLRELDVKASVAASRAINATSDRARAEAARRIREQVGFPARYVSGQDGRLTVTKYARGDDLEAVITGRQRPTSLARFVTGGATAGLARRGKPLTVAVKPGGAVTLTRAFLIKLRAGNAALDTQFNLGLAVRTGGGKPRGAYKPLLIGKDLYLLYGPSVDQVFKTVRGDIAPDMADYLEREFYRLLDLELA